MGSPMCAASASFFSEIITVKFQIDEMSTVETDPSIGLAKAAVFVSDRINKSATWFIARAINQRVLQTSPSIPQYGLLSDSGPDGQTSIFRVANTNVEALAQCVDFFF